MYYDIFQKRLSFPGRVAPALLIVVIAIILGFQGSAEAARQKTFESPEVAIAALVKATTDNNVKELMTLFGPGSRSMVSSGDPVDDRNDRQDFIKAYNEKNHLEMTADGKFTLFVGKDDWPFPVPVVKTGNRWRFDAKAGKDEIINRRIGENELDTIQVCLAILDAERDYADMMRDSAGHPEYAQKFISDKGKKNGLYWKTAEGEKPSPLGPLVARAHAEGYRKTGSRPSPYHGYFYRILKVQGPDANGGAYDYIVNGKMIGGFALVAYPAFYGKTGVRTFIVNHEGIIYQKDLGKDTLKIAESMSKFDPDKTWTKYEPENPVKPKE